MEFRIVESRETLSFEPQALIIAGFTGRSRAKVQEHIDEMRAHGVPIPDSYPTFYPVPMSLLTQERAIDVKTHESSGEVEPVLIVRDDAWYVTLGSDHTARDEEKFDIARSKAACPKIVCKEVWRYADVRAHWDQLTLRGWAFENGAKIDYQSGTCGDVVPAEDLVQLARERVPNLRGDFVMCMGTLPLMPGKFIYATRYGFELKDPVRANTLALEYDVAVT